MAATASTVSFSENKESIASELVSLINRVDYTNTIRPLKESDAVPIDDFKKLDISNWYELDTSKCFVGKRKFKFNPHTLYDIFADYAELDKFVVKNEARKRNKC